MLDGTNGNGRPGRDFFGQGARRSFQLRGGKNVIDDAQAQRRLRVDHLTGVEHFRGLGRPDQLRQKIRAAIIGKQSNARKVLPKAGVFRRQANIGSQRDIHARSSGRAMHHGNHRLRHGANLQHRLHTGTQQGFEMFRFAGLAAFADDAQISASTKRTPGAG